MKKGEYYIPDLDFEYKLWKNTLCYLQEQKTLYSTRIDELLSELNVPEGRPYVKDDLEELKNRFVAFEENINDVSKQIHLQEDEMGIFARDYPITSSHQHFVEHECIRFEMDELAKLFQELRKEFSIYLV